MTTEPATSRVTGAVRFAVIADAQYCDHDIQWERHFRDSLAKLAAAAADINDADVRFTVHLGDLVDRDAASFAPALAAFNQVEGARHHLLGNHDFVADLDPTEISTVLGMPDRYYSFLVDQLRFVVLDTNDVSTYGNPPGSSQAVLAEQWIADLRTAGAPNGEPWNGGVGAEQLSWLRSQLDEAAAAGERVIVLGHCPIVGTNVHNALNASEILAVLESSPQVIAYLNGHDHAGRYEYVNGIHHLNFHGMVEHPAPDTAYAIVTVTGTAIEVAGRGREPSRVLPLAPR